MKIRTKLAMSLLTLILLFSLIGFGYFILMKIERSINNDREESFKLLANFNAGMNITSSLLSSPWNDVYPKWEDAINKFDADFTKISGKKSFIFRQKIVQEKLVVLKKTFNNYQTGSGKIKELSNKISSEIIRT